MVGHAAGCTVASTIELPLPLDPLPKTCPTLAQADTDSIPAAQGSPPGSPWMRYSQESDSPIVR